MAYNQKTVEIWYSSAQTINRYRSKLGEYEKFFDTLYYSVSNSSYSSDEINAACEYLKNKARTVSNRDLKAALNDFVITAGDCYDPEYFKDFRKYLKSKGLLPVKPKNSNPAPVTKQEVKQPDTPPKPSPKPFDWIPKPKQYRENWWRRTNRKIKNFSERFWSKHEDIHINIYLLATALSIVAGIVYVIFKWVNNGFWPAVGGLIMAALAVIAFSIAAYILIWPLMFLFRCITYNLASLIISIAIIIGIGAPVAINTINDYTDTFSRLMRSKEKKDKERANIKYTTTYICSANSLIVRREPNRNSAKLGTISKGQEVEVYEIVNGFAKILWDAKFAYISEEYIQKKE